MQYAPGRNQEPHQERPTPDRRATERHKPPSRRLRGAGTLLTSLAGLTLGACGGADEPGLPSGGLGALQGPPDGTWVGDHLDLELQDGQVVAVTLKAVYCAQTDPAWPALRLCTSEKADETVDASIRVDSAPNPVLNAPEWRLDGDVGPVGTLSAVFSTTGALGETLDVIHGIFDYYDQGDCDCHARYTFEARFSPPDGWTGPDGSVAPTPAPGDGPGAPGPATPGDAPDDATPPQIEALDRVNEFRFLVGLPPVDMLASLNSMAMDHCACYSMHQAEYQATGMSAHAQNPAWGPPCHGNLGQRAAHVGYNGPIGEVMAFYDDPVRAVNAFMATLYHRLPLVSPQTYVIGYGHATGCDTINNGSTSAAAGDYEIIYPFADQTAVDTCWHGWESPQPPPPPGGYPSGPIVTLEFSPGAVFRIEGSSITGPSGDELAHHLLVPTSGGHSAGDEDPWMPREAVSVYTFEPLDVVTTYTVALWGTKGGAPWEKRWSFTTAPTPTGCW